jgi:hypothetical protein
VSTYVNTICLLGMLGLRNHSLQAFVHTHIIVCSSVTVRLDAAQTTVCPLSVTSDEIQYNITKTYGSSQNQFPFTPSLCFEPKLLFIFVVEVYKLGFYGYKCM